MEGRRQLRQADRGADRHGEQQERRNDVRAPARARPTHLELGRDAREQHAEREDPAIQINEGDVAAHPQRAAGRDDSSKSAMAPPTADGSITRPRVVHSSNSPGDDTTARDLGAQLVAGACARADR